MKIIGKSYTTKIVVYNVIGKHELNTIDTGGTKPSDNPKNDSLMVGFTIGSDAVIRI